MVMTRKLTLTALLFGNLMVSGKCKAVQKLIAHTDQFVMVVPILQEIAKVQRQVARWHSPFLQGVTVNTMARPGRWGVVAWILAAVMFDMLRHVLRIRISVICWKLVRIYLQRALASKQELACVCPQTTVEQCIRYFPHKLSLSFPTSQRA